MSLYVWRTETEFLSKVNKEKSQSKELGYIFFYGLNESYKDVDIATKVKDVKKLPNRFRKGIQR